MRFRAFDAKNNRYQEFTFNDLACNDDEVCIIFKYKKNVLRNIKVDKGFITKEILEEFHDYIPISECTIELIK